MRALLALIFLVLVALVVFLIVREALRGLARVRARRRAQQEPWKVDEHSDGEMIKVYAIKPGEERLLIGSAAFASLTFEDRIEELRSQARMKVAALNSGRLGR